MDKYIGFDIDNKKIAACVMHMPKYVLKLQDDHRKPDRVEEKQNEVFSYGNRTISSHWARW